MRYGTRIQLRRLKSGKQFNLYVVFQGKRCQSLDYYAGLPDKDREDIRGDFQTLIDHSPSETEGVLVKKYRKLNCYELVSSSHRFFFDYQYTKKPPENLVVVYYGLKKQKQRISADQEKTIKNLIRSVNSKCQS